MNNKYTIQEAFIILDENSNVVGWFDVFEDAEAYVEDMEEEN